MVLHGTRARLRIKHMSHIQSMLLSHIDVSLSPSPSLKQLFIDFQRERHQFVVSLIHALTGCFLHAPSLEMDPATLAYWEDTPTECLARASEPLL